jgi:UDPglucose--hexose-1-phosphate uridylyltransferase
MVNELRWNPLAHRWVTIASGREGRPLEGSLIATRSRRAQHEPGCPFCPGNESETLPEIVTVRDGAEPWSVRVVPNKYPSFAGTGIAPPDGEETAPSSGTCEVVIFTPDHHRDVADLDTYGVIRFLSILLERRAEHALLPGVRHTSIIVNRGVNSGASLVHAHAQVLSTSFIPPRVDDELRGFSKEPELFRRVFGRDHRGVVARRDGAIAGCPTWAGLPYESWIVPTEPRTTILEDKPELLHDVAELLVDLLRRLRRVLGDIDHNIIFRLPPHGSEETFMSHIQVLPRHVPIAGFEISSGISVNSVPPESAAHHLRAAVV